MTEESFMSDTWQGARDGANDREYAVEATSEQLSVQKLVQEESERAKKKEGGGKKKERTRRHSAPGHGDNQQKKFIPPNEGYTVLYRTSHEAGMP